MFQDQEMNFDRSFDSNKDQKAKKRGHEIMSGIFKAEAGATEATQKAKSVSAAIISLTSLGTNPKLPSMCAKDSSDSGTYKTRAL